MEKTKKIDLVFMGTAAFGVPLLRALATDPRFHVSLVVTQEDRPAGRNLKNTPSPVKQTAEELGLKVFQPKDVNATTSVEAIHELPLPIIVVVAYGQILKKDLLGLPPFGCVNVHGSLLPKYRGASPIQSALLHGETETGLSVMRMEEGLDSGPVYKTIPTPITQGDTAQTLHDRLAAMAAKKVPDVLSDIVLKKIESEPQDHARATLCSKITKEAGRIDWNESAETIERKIRAFAGWPGTYAFWNKKAIKILAADVAPGSGRPGVVRHDNGRLLIGAGQEILEVRSIQIEGKKPQPAEAFLRGHPDFIHAVLE